MASLGILVLPLVLYVAGLVYVVDARPQYHLEKRVERSGSDWNKRPFHGKEDYYGFLTDEQKRAGPHPGEKYMDFLVGDKRTVEKKNDGAYWDFIGANIKRTNTRRKRSTGDVLRPKSIPSGSAAASAVGGNGGNGGGSSLHHHQTVVGGQPRRLDPRSAPRDTEDEVSWDDFVIGRKRSSGRDGNMNFDDFLTGDKRGISDYDYAEFVLGKRP